MNDSHETGQRKVETDQKSLSDIENPPVARSILPTEPSRKESNEWPFFTVTLDKPHFHPNPLLGRFGFYVKFQDEPGAPAAIYLLNPSSRQWVPMYALTKLPVGMWLALRAPDRHRFPVDVYLNPDRRSLRARWVGVNEEAIPPGRWDREFSPQEAANLLQLATAQSELRRRLIEGIKP